MARPSWVPPDLNEVEKLAACGLSQRQLALALGISYETLRKKKKDLADFEEAIERGKAKAIVQVANKNFEAAIGGNVIAQMFWLKTRGAEEWNEQIIVARALKAAADALMEQSQGETGVMQVPTAPSSADSLQAMSEMFAKQQQELQTKTEEIIDNAR
ncbi:hypothetical protein P3547_19835 [Vibrio parahaemolyticus]|nr:hypothetical protein [Vibrio parahaemolyticus]